VAWHAGIHNDGEFNLFAPLREQTRATVQLFPEVKVEGFEGEHSGFDFRKVQNVIQNGEERVGACGDGSSQSVFVAG
jgi:hypothetical protein